MKDVLIDKYTKEELEQIVENSSCLRDVVRALGYSATSGSNNATVRKRLNHFKIDTSHFVIGHKTERTIQNIFKKDSTASQKTLRDWYKKDIILSIVVLYVLKNLFGIIVQ